jgi:hypothetical protein
MLILATHGVLPPWGGGHHGPIHRHVFCVFRLCNGDGRYCEGKLMLMAHV